MSTMERQVMMLRHVSFTILLILMLWLPSWVMSFESYKLHDHVPIAMRERYDKWVERYGKQYQDGEERERRFGIYVSNVQIIDQVNSQNLTYKLTDNKFADLTNDEFKAIYLGYRSSPATSNFSYAKLEHSPPSKSVDWRKKGVLTPIKDQGQCGCCWAFSAVCAVESINKIKTGKLLSLSEQELVDCDVLTGNEGCNGGLMNKAFQFVNKNGLTTEKNYPYKGSDSSCDTKRGNFALGISGYKKVPENSENSLKAAVAKQPVSVAMDAGSSEFQLYSEGIFSGNCGKQLNHGVNAVGYGQVRGRKGKKYWIVRNSWGKDWGESGYFRLLRGIRDKAGKCGIAMEASYPGRVDLRMSIFTFEMHSRVEAQSS